MFVSVDRDAQEVVRYLAKGPPRALRVLALVLALALALGRVFHN